MMDRHYIDLMNRLLDGEITDQQRADLDRCLAEDHQAHELLGDLTAAEEILHKLDRVDPPQEMKGQILRKIDRAKYVAKPRQSRQSRTWKIQSNLKYAYSFAAGLILGVAVYALSTGTLTRDRNANLSPLTGTILSGERIENLQAGDHREFAGEGFQGTLQTEFGGNLALVSVSVESSREIELVMEFDPKVASFHGYHQSYGKDGKMQTSAGMLRLTHMGKNEYVFVFHRQPGHTFDLAFAVHAGGVLYEERLKIADKRSE